MAFLFDCKCKNCGHAPKQHADLLEQPSSTDHCLAKGCECNDYEPSCGVCNGCLEMEADWPPPGEQAAAERMSAACEHEENVHHVCVFCGALRRDDGGYEAPIRRARPFDLEFLARVRRTEN